MPRFKEHETWRESTQNLQPGQQEQHPKDIKKKKREDILRNGGRAETVGAVHMAPHHMGHC